MATARFKKDAGLKSVYETLTSILRSDHTLKGLMDFDPKNPNIRRSYGVQGEWKKLLVYYFQPETMMTDFSPNIRRVPLIVSMYARENELDLLDIGERVIQLLDKEGSEAALSKAGYVRVFDCAYQGEIIGSQFVEKIQAFTKSQRYIVTFRKEE